MADPRRGEGGFIGPGRREGDAGDECQFSAYLRQFIRQDNIRFYYFINFFNKSIHSKSGDCGPDWTSVVW